MENTTLSSVMDKNFLQEIQLDINKNVNLCYQCKKCTAGCPIIYEMDYTPTQIIQAVRLGVKDLVLGSKTIWLCASCETCSTRCPQDIDIAGVMDAARIMSKREGIKPAVNDIPSLHKSFLQIIKMFGRSYELGLIGLLKLRTKEFTKDLKLGLKMFRLGKLKIFPQISNTSKVRRIFSKVKKIEQEKK